MKTYSKIKTLEKNMITQSKLKSFLHYEPSTGIFILKINTRKLKAGDRAEKMHNKGYLRIAIEGNVYLAHRLAWLYVFGEWPKNQIDHINRNKQDNRIENLREATNGENQQNKKCKGYYFCKSSNFWRMHIRINGEVHRQRYATEQEARNAYEQAKIIYHTFNPVPIR